MKVIVTFYAIYNQWGWHKTEYIQYLFYINIEYTRTKFRRTRWKGPDSEELSVKGPGEERPGVEVPDPERQGAEDVILMDQIQKDGIQKDQIQKDQIE